MVFKLLDCINQGLSAGADPGGGGAQYSKHKVFSCEPKSYAWGGGRGHALPDFFFLKKMVQFGAFWCILGPIFAVFEVILRQSRLLQSNQDTIIIPLYFNRNSKHLSRSNKNILNKNYHLR